MSGAGQLGYLGLGSNLGGRRENLQAAVDAMAAHGIAVLASSSTYDTDPVGLVLDQPAFLNACLQVSTALGPEQLLDACKTIEAALGRELEGGMRHGPRPIDIDLLLLGDLVYQSDRLRLPHAATSSRRFVLIPLLELDFDLRAPDGSPLSEALVALGFDEGVRREGPPLTLPSSA